VLILKEVKVLCFDTLLKMLILNILARDVDPVEETGEKSRLVEETAEGPPSSEGLRTLTCKVQ
jgi:hypothetical protein